MNIFIIYNEWWCAAGCQWTCSTLGCWFSLVKTETCAERRVTGGLKQFTLATYEKMWRLHTDEMNGLWRERNGGDLPKMKRLQCYKELFILLCLTLLLVKCCKGTKERPQRRKITLAEFLYQRLHRLGIKRNRRRQQEVKCCIYIFHVPFNF